MTQMCFFVLWIVILICKTRSTPVEVACTRECFSFKAAVYVERLHTTYFWCNKNRGQNTDLLGKGALHVEKLHTTYFWCNKNRGQNTDLFGKQHFKFESYTPLIFGAIKTGVKTQICLEKEHFMLKSYTPLTFGAVKTGVKTRICWGKPVYAKQGSNLQYAWQKPGGGGVLWRGNDAGVPLTRRKIGGCGCCRIAKTVPVRGAINKKPYPWWVLGKSLRRPLVYFTKNSMNFNRFYLIL